MSGLIRKAEQVLDVAAQSAETGSGQFIVVDNSGSIRIVASSCWSLAGLIDELGAREVFHVQKVLHAVRVEAWSKNERCVVQRQLPASRFIFRNPLQSVHPIMLQGGTDGRLE